MPPPETQPWVIQVRNLAERDSDPALFIARGLLEMYAKPYAVLHPIHQDRILAHARLMVRADLDRILADSYSI